MMKNCEVVVPSTHAPLNDQKKIQIIHEMVDIEKSRSTENGSISIPDSPIFDDTKFEKNTHEHKQTLEEEARQISSAIWFPREISDLDNCTNVVTRYQPELCMDHPALGDKLYQERRQEIANLAFSYKYGKSIPTVSYTLEEISTWGVAFKEMDKLVNQTCKEYRDIWQVLKKEGIYSEHKIPQLKDVSDFMNARTGFTLKPAAGLLSSRDFLASLSFRVFQCTQYVRHHKCHSFSPDPDVIHELVGHVPLFSDPSFAEFCQEIGLASLGATDEEITKITSMFWFTVEVGLCREKEELKVWGAALLSSFGELKHSLSSVPQLKPFDPETTSIQTFNNHCYQKVYYVSETIKDATLKFRKWVRSTLQRPYDIKYNSSSQSVYIVENLN